MAPASGLLALLAIPALAVALSQPHSRGVAGSDALRVLTYNVRYDSLPDDKSVQETIDSLPSELPSDPLLYYSNTAEQPWSTRRIHVANDILWAGVDLYGGQEILKRQLDDLQELLGADWDHVGVGRDDGVESGEYSPIFFRNSTIQLLDWDTFWLTNTPFDVSRYPDAGSYRIATTAHFTSPSTGNFTHINTHLDNVSSNQRRLGTSLILHRAKYEAIKSHRPVIVTGDFNSPITDGAYKIIVGEENPEPLNSTFLDQYSWTADEEFGFEDFVMRDLLGQAPPRFRGGDHATFTGFVTVGDTTQYSRIDYVLAGSNGGWISQSYHVSPNLYDDGVYASDHRPVYADISLSST